MDLDNLQNALENLDLKAEAIRGVAQYCIINSVNSQFQIAKLIQKHFLRHKDARVKTALFLLVSDIFLQANLRKNKQFFKHLSPKIKPFLQTLISDLLQNLELAAMVANAIEKWHLEQIFAESFLDRVKDIANPILAKLNEERAGGGKHEKFTKYKKTFLMELMDVRKFEPSSKIYDTFVQMQDLSARINGFQQAYNKLDFDSPTQDTMKRGKQLLRASEDYRERLQNLICGFHLGFKILADECREDFSKLESRNE